MKKIARTLCFLCLAIVVSLSLSACQKNNDKDKVKKRKVIVAKIQPIVTALYFPGTLMPIGATEVTSPVDGRIKELRFQYGQEVVKGADLLAIDSQQLSDEFRKSVNDFLQKKTTYNNSVINYQGEQALFKAGVVNRQSYLTSTSSFQNDTLNFLQAKYHLDVILKKVDIAPQTIEKLTLADTEAVNKILSKRFDKIVVKSPATGVALFPVDDQSSDSSSGSGSKSGKLHVGSSVKNGQLMLSIGNLSGLRADIAVSEVNVGQLKAGMDATVTGDAFPQVTLKGTVASVASQAKPGSSGSGAVSQFSAVIKIPNISKKAREKIRVGMTARIQVSIKRPPQIVLPISAITAKGQQSFVTLLDAEGKEKEVSVMVGSTTPDGIIILKGVKPGDKVVIHD